MAIAFVQKSPHQSNPGTTSTTSTYTFTTQPTPGNALVVSFIISGPVGVSATCADNQGNTYNATVSQNNATANNARVIIFVATNIASSGTHTITVTATPSGGNYFPEWNVSEWSGVHSVYSSAVRDTGTFSSPDTGGANRTSITYSSSGSSAQSGDVAITAMLHDLGSGTMVWTNPSGYTTLTQQTNATATETMASAYQILSSGGSQSITWGFSASTNAVASGLVILQPPLTVYNNPFQGNAFEVSLSAAAAAGGTFNDSINDTTASAGSTQTGQTDFNPSITDNSATAGATLTPNLNTIASTINETGASAGDSYTVVSVDKPATYTETGASAGESPSATQGVAATYTETGATGGSTQTAGLSYSYSITEQSSGVARAQTSTATGNLFGAAPSASTITLGSQPSIGSFVIAMGASFNGGGANTNVTTTDNAATPNSYSYLSQNNSPSGDGYHRAWMNYGFVNSLPSSGNLAVTSTVTADYSFSNWNAVVFNGINSSSTLVSSGVSDGYGAFSSATATTSGSVPTGSLIVVVFSCEDYNAPTDSNITISGSGWTVETLDNSYTSDGNAQIVAWKVADTTGTQSATVNFLSSSVMTFGMVIAGFAALPATADSVSSSMGAVSLSLTESTTATESNSTTGSFGTSVTETGTSSESNSTTGSFGTSTTETGTAGFTPTNIATLNVSTTETGTAGESPTNNINFATVSTTETGTASDTETSSLSYAVSVTETGTAGDTETGLTIYPVSTTETGTAGESPSAITTFNPTVSDAGTAGESNSTTAVLNTSTSESGSATDTNVGSANEVQSITETASATDTETHTLGIPTSVSESASAGDTNTGVGVLNQAYSQSTTAGESPSAITTFNPSVTETGTAGDSSSNTGSVNGSTTESGTASDSYPSIATMNVSGSDAGSATDSESFGASSFNYTVVEKTTGIVETNSTARQMFSGSPAGATLTLANQPVLGSLVVVMGTSFVGGGGSTAVTVSDNAQTPNTYSQLTHTNSVDNFHRSYISYGFVNSLPSSGNLQVTSLAPDFVYHFFNVTSFANVSSTAGLVTSGTLTDYSGSNSSYLAGATVTTSGSAQVGDIVFAVMVLEDYNGITNFSIGLSDQNWKIETQVIKALDNQGNQVVTAWKIVDTAGTQSATFNWTSSNAVTFVADIAVFRPTSAVNDVNTAGNQIGPSVTETGSSNYTTTNTVSFVNSTTETGSSSDTETSTVVYPVSITETVTATDSVSPIGASAGSLTESLGASDAESAVTTFNASTSDSGSAGDTHTGVNTGSSSTTETATATDSESAITTFNASVAESATATDSVTSIQTGSSSVSESGTAVDSSSTTAVMSSTYTDSSTASDSNVGSAGENQSTTETASATDSETASNSVPTSVSESVSAGDSNTGVNNISTSVTESGTSAYTPSAVTTFNASTTETSSATDSVVGANVISASTSESGTVTDSETAVTAFNPTVTETGTATDSETSISTGSSSVTETATASDSETAVTTFNASVTETVSATDSYPTTAVQNSSVSESASSGSTQTNIATLPNSITETSTVTDSVVGSNSTYTYQLIEEAEPVVRKQTSSQYTILASISPAAGTITFGSQPAIGSLVILAGSSFNGGASDTSVTVSDNAAVPNSYSQITYTSAYYDAQHRAYLSYAFVDSLPSSGNLQVTSSVPLYAYNVFNATEFSNIDRTSPIVTTGYLNGFSGDTPAYSTGITLTTPGAASIGDLIFVSVALEDYNNIASFGPSMVGSGWTVETVMTSNDGDPNLSITAWKMVTADGTQTAQVAWPSSNQLSFGAFITVLRQASALTSSQTLVNGVFVSVSETLSGSDTETATTGRVGSVTESGTATDTETNVATLQNSVSESLTSSDIVSPQGYPVGVLSESGTASDSYPSIATMNVSITETVTASDSHTGSAGENQSTSDSVSATDSETASNSVPTSVSESGSVGESSSVTSDRVVSINEAALSADANTLVAVGNASVSESVSGAQSSTTQLSAVGSLSESGTAADSYPSIATMNVSVTETVTASDVNTAGNVTYTHVLVERSVAVQRTNTSTPIYTGANVNPSGGTITLTNQPSLGSFVVVAGSSFIGGGGSTVMTVSDNAQTPNTYTQISQLNNDPDTYHRVYLSYGFVTSLPASGNLQVSSLINSYVYSYFNVSTFLNVNSGVSLVTSGSSNGLVSGTGASITTGSAQVGDIVFTVLTLEDYNAIANFQFGLIGQGWNIENFQSNPGTGDNTITAWKIVDTDGAQTVQFQWTNSSLVTYSSIAAVFRPNVAANDAEAVSTSDVNSITETLTAATTFSQLVTFADSVANTATSNDSVSQSVAFNPSITDTGTVTDDVSTSGAGATSLSESGVANFAITSIATMSSSTTEAVSASELLTGVAGENENVTSSTTSTESSSATTGAAGSTSESSSVGDSVVGTAEAVNSLSETTSSGESSTTLATLLASSTETVTATFATTSLATMSSSTSEGATAVDSMPSTAVMNVSITETVTAADSHVGTNNTYTYVVSERPTPAVRTNSSTVQSITTSGAPATRTVTLSTQPSLGSLVIVAGSSFTGSGPTDVTVSDNALVPNTYTQLTHTTSYYDAQHRTFISYAIVNSLPASGNLQVTGTAIDYRYLTFNAVSFANIDPTAISTYGMTDGFSGDNVINYTGASVSTSGSAQVGDVLYAAISLEDYNDVVGFTISMVGSGWTVESSLTAAANIGDQCLTAWKIVDNPGIQTAAFSWPSSNQVSYSLIAAVFKTSGAIDAVAGGNASPNSVSESVTSAASQTSTLNAVGSTSESVTATDVEIQVVAFNPSIADSTAATDDVSTSGAGATSVSESVTGAFVITSIATMSSSVTESASATDSHSGSAGENQSTSETSSAVDSVTGSNSVAPSVSESSSAGESSSAITTFNPTVNESGVGGDTNSTITVQNSSVTETVTAAFAASPIGINVVSISEGVTAVDSYPSIATMGVSVSESVTATDSLSPNNVTYTYTLVERPANVTRTNSSATVSSFFTNNPAGGTVTLTTQPAIGSLVMAIGASFNGGFADTTPAVTDNAAVPNTYTLISQTNTVPDTFHRAYLSYSFITSLPASGNLQVSSNVPSYAENVFNVVSFSNVDVSQGVVTSGYSSGYTGDTPAYATGVTVGTSGSAKVGDIVFTVLALEDYHDYTDFSIQLTGAGWNVENYLFYNALSGNQHLAAWKIVTADGVQNATYSWTSSDSLTFGAFIATFRPINTLSDAESAVFALPTQNYSESASATDALTLNAVANTSVAETTSSTETTNGVVNVVTQNVSDSGSASDSYPSIATMNVSRTDSGSATDTEAASVILVTVNVSESTTSADAVSHTYAANTTLTDSLASIDSVSSVSTGSSSTTESVSGTDAYSNTVSLTSSVAESTTSADTIFVSVNGGTVNLNETVTSLDAISSTLVTVTANVTESVTSSDNVTSSVTLVTLSISESATCVDSISSILNSNSALSETGSVSDVLIGSAGDNVSISDTGTSAYTVTQVYVANVSVSEAVTAGDTADGIVIGSISSISESVSALDLVQSVTSFNPSCNENVSSVDSISSIVTFAIVNVSESGVTSDNVVSTDVSSSSVSETGSSTFTATSIATASVSITETAIADSTFSQITLANPFINETCSAVDVISSTVIYSIVNVSETSTSAAVATTTAGIAASYSDASSAFDSLTSDTSVSPINESATAADQLQIISDYRNHIIDAASADSGQFAVIISSESVNEILFTDDTSTAGFISVGNLTEISAASDVLNSIYSGGLSLTESVTATVTQNGDANESVSINTPTSALDSESATVAISLVHQGTSVAGFNQTSTQVSNESINEAVSAGSSISQSVTVSISFATTASDTVDGVNGIVISTAYSAVAAVSLVTSAKIKINLKHVALAGSTLNVTGPQTFGFVESTVASSSISSTQLMSSTYVDGSTADFTVDGQIINIDAQVQTLTGTQGTQIDLGDAVKLVNNTFRTKHLSDAHAFATLSSMDNGLNLGKDSITDSAASSIISSGLSVTPSTNETWRNDVVQPVPPAVRVGAPARFAKILISDDTKKFYEKDGQIIEGSNELFPPASEGGPTYEDQTGKFED